MPRSTGPGELYSLGACRGKSLEGEPTLERPIAERGWGDITGHAQRHTHLGDRRADLGGERRKGFQVEAVQTPRVAAQNLAARVFRLVVQSPPDGQFGMWRKP